MSYFAAGNRFMYFDYLSAKPIYVDTKEEAIIGEKEERKKYADRVHANYDKFPRYQKLAFEKVLEEKGFIPVGKHKEFNTVDNCNRRWKHPELGFANFFLWHDEKSNHPKIGLKLQCYRDSEIMELPNELEEIEKYFPK